MKKLIIIFCVSLVAFTVTSSTKAAAQDHKSLRTNTWSVYAQGGVSWATGVNFMNISQTKGTSIAPEIGVGVNYNIRPWVRLGLNYEFSKFKREQRFSEFLEIDPIVDMTGSGMTELLERNGGIAYRKLKTNYHSLDLTAEFNIMEIWKNRKCTWFNLYAGTGIGVMFAKGNTYDIGMGSESWGSPDDFQNGLQVGDNKTYVAWVKANNNHHSFNAAYIPIGLSAEFDVLPRLTLGAKFQYKAVISSNDFAPNGLEVAAVTVRYNILGAKHGIRSNKQMYHETLDRYNASMDSYNNLRSQYEAAKAKAGEAEADYKKELDALNAANGALRQQLKECEDKNNVQELTVQFECDGSKISAYNQARLTELAKQLKAGETATISLVGEASADGRETTNKKLSQKRLDNVVAVLKKNGIESDRIKSAKAIGDANKIYDASNRKVVITVDR